MNAERAKCSSAHLKRFFDICISQVGFGGASGTGIGGQNRRQPAGGTETAGSAFQMFLGGSRDTAAADGAGASGMGSGDGGETRRGLPGEESPDGPKAPAAPLPVRSIVWWYGMFWVATFFFRWCV